MNKPTSSTGDKTKRVFCANCVHYYITWDQRFPYGCRILNFKSHKPPYLSVFESSGMPCQLFESKEDKTKS
ncbi:MAG: uracil-DNA glycosylase [Candidatus Omnitrophota bacterium]